jgi:hypothetical protein
LLIISIQGIKKAADSKRLHSVGNKETQFDWRPASGEQVAAASFLQQAPFFSDLLLVFLVSSVFFLQQADASFLQQSLVFFFFLSLSIEIELDAISEAFRVLTEKPAERKETRASRMKMRFMCVCVCTKVRFN